MVHDRIRIEALLSDLSTLGALGGEMERPRLRSTTSETRGEELACGAGNQE